MRGSTTDSGSNFLKAFRESGEASTVPNYEDHQEEEEEDEEEEEEETPVIKKTLDDRFNLQSTLIVRKKTNTKTSNSTGVDDIQKLPLDWFQSVKQTNKQNKIIPRQKEHM